MNNPIIEPGPGPKILLVDDDPKFQKLMLRVLKKHGFEVTVCNDGIEAKYSFNNLIGQSPSIFFA